MLFSEIVNVADSFLVVNLADSNEDAGFFHFSKTIVDGCAKHLHGGGKAHIGIDQWRYVVTQCAHLMVQNLVVFLERIFAEKLLKFFRVILQLKRFGGDYESVFVTEVFAQEIKNHVTSLTVVTGVHGHLTEEILTSRHDDCQGTKSVPQVVEGKDGFTIGTSGLVLESDE